MKRFLWLKWALGMVAVCFIACICVNAMAEENAPVITVVFDKDSVNIGETITAQYEITGNGSYEEVSLDWWCRGHDGSWQSTSTDYGTDLKGKTSFTPKFGKAVQLSVWVKDLNGQRFGFDSEEIPVIGDSTVPPTISVSFDKDSMNIGEAITAQYEITGNGSYEEVSLDWWCRGHDGSWQSTSTDYGTDLKGKTSFTPKFGKAVQLSVWVKDLNGQRFGFDSEEIPIIGDSTVPPTISISFDKDSMNIGETITAQYEITGNGSYEEVSLDWWCRGHDGSWQSTSTDYGTDLKGKTSFTPKFGKAVQLSVWVKDLNGQRFGLSSEEIPITGTTGAQTSYQFIEGGNTPAFTNSALTFRVNADFDKFRGVLVDDQPVDQSNYAAWSGSTFIQMKESYLQTLSDGKHMLSVLFSDGYAETPFTISKANAAPLPPKTGDANHPALWMALLCISLLGILELRRRALRQR